MKYWEIIADNLSNAGWSWGLFQRLIPTGERSGIAEFDVANGTASVTLCGPSQSPFAAPKRIILRYNRRLSGVLITLTSITSSDVSTYPSARLNKPQGLDLR